MPLRKTCICLLLLILSATPAFGRGTVELVQQQGLFLLEDFQQWAGVNYQYSGHSSDTSNSSSQKLQEIYHAQGGLAILNPHFINFALNADIGFDQTRSSSDKGGNTNAFGGSSSTSGNTAHYQYGVDVSVLDRSWHPVEVFSSRTQDTVVTPFSPTFDTTVSRSGVAALFNKSPYIIRFRYETNTQDVSGGGINTSSTSDSFQSSFSHSFRDINVFNADFGLAATESTQEGARQTGTTNTVNAADTLFFGGKRQYTLISELQRQYTSTEGLPQTTLNWNESLQARLGKALDGETTYRYSSNRTTITAGREQFYDTNNFTAQLRHHLFQSVDTVLGGTYGTTTLPGGDETRYSGRIGVTYHKLLPALSRLTVAVNGDHEVTDRTGSTTLLKVQNEAHLVLQPNQVIQFNVGGAVQEGSVIVQGFLLPPSGPNIPPNKVYIEGLDYTVDYLLGRITWSPFVPSVPNITISYTVNFDPSVKYATDSINFNSSLSLFGGRYLFSLLYMDQSRTLLSGESQNGLYSSEFFTLRGQRMTESQTYTLEYSKYVAGPSKYQYVEGGVQLTPQLSDYTFQFEARDRYTMYDASGTTPAHTGNTVSAAASSSRSLFGRALFLVSVNAVDERGEQIQNSDSIFLRSSLRTRFNKLTISLVGSSGWRMARGTTSRDDNVRIEIMRTF